MNSSRGEVNRNARFYFTEEGWRRHGRKTVEVCQQVGQRYRVLRFKESAVNMISRNEHQVAVLPKKKSRDKNTLVNPNNSLVALPSLPITEKLAQEKIASEKVGLEDGLLCE